MGRRKPEYDERQKLLRGNGYKYSFVTAIVWMFLIMLVDILEIDSIFSMQIFAFTGIVITALVNCAYCIWHDAYWGLNNNRRKYIWLLGILAILNGIFPIRMIATHEMIMNGQVNSAFINLECSIFMILMAALVDVSRQTINAIEKGDYNPTIRLCIAICKALDMSLDELFWDE